MAISPHLPQTPACSFKSLYRKRANTPCALSLRASDTTLRLMKTGQRECKCRKRAVRRESFTMVKRRPLGPRALA